jgi:hypothetical protein
MKARTALVELFKESQQWRAFFRSCCEASAFRLRYQVWQFREKLLEQGHHIDREDREDALFDLACRHFADSPATDLSEWATLVYGEALTHLQEHFSGLSEEEKETLDLSTTEEADDKMEVACRVEDRAAFREAVREYERATQEAALGRVQGEADEASSSKGAA